jgi:isopentenyl diphosphate isomerase/L-lactate dehydrogenase-like FMN-dependent dehydrogenase
MALQTRRDLLTRVAPRTELVNILEFEAEAERRLPADLFRVVSGGDRAAFEHMTFRPRMMVNCLDLNLSLDLLGVPLFAPIIVGPVADQRRFHADGELATVRGASAARAAVVVSSRSSHGVQAIAAAATTPLLFQVFGDDGTPTIRSQAQEAERAGCKAVILTVGAPPVGTRRAARIDWTAVDALRNAVSVPVLVKGAMTALEATTAVTHGAQGLVVSNYGRPTAPGQLAPLEVLAPVVDAVGAAVPVLLDGGLRRGTDVMKALALGARAVLVARPVMWGLAAYGAEGVQSVVEMLQTELGRVMGCCGTPGLAAITRRVVKVHAPQPPRGSA